MRVGYAEGKLEGDWAVFNRIADYFAYRVLPEDREDFHQDFAGGDGQGKGKV